MTDTIISDALGDVLRGWNATTKASIDAARMNSAATRRFDYQGTYPVKCVPSPAPPASKEPAE